MPWYYTLLGIPPGSVIGWYARSIYGILAKPVAPEEVTPLMTRVVNGEEAEAQRNHVRKTLHDTKRRSMRTDGGPPAKVHKMRRKRTATRHPID